MTSPHRFLANDRNAIVDATVTASSVLPATATAFPAALARTGTARAILSGGYTGEADTVIEAEIVSASGAGLASEPVFIGAGNGALTNLSVDGVPAQSFTLLLASLGTATKPAAVAFYGVKLLAKAGGDAGNGITLTVSLAGLSFALAPYSFFEEAKAGTAEFAGPQWDFGCYPLTIDGEIDPRTPRLRFDHDPQIYRQYKTLVGNDWRYVIDPPIVRDLPAKTPVYLTTGTYTVTVEQGATTETYTGIVTLFDLLNALKTRSNLLTVDGVVVDDRTPGGMAVEDLPLRTDAYALPATYQGNAKFPGLGGVTVPSNAPTEILELTCVDDSVTGGETWRPRGVISGEFPYCYSGVPYSILGYAWTVPQVFVDDPTAEPTGGIYVKDIDFVSRAENDPAQPELCVSPLVAGAKAKAKTITAVYTAKPPVDADCRCVDAEAAGSLSAACLGIKVIEEAKMALDPEYQSRLQDLYGWQATITAANTGIGSGRVYGARDELALIERIINIFSGALGRLFAKDTPNNDSLTAWDAALTAMQTDLGGIDDQTGFDADGWPTGAKLWANGTTLDVGDYVKTDRADVTPVAWKVTETYEFDSSGTDPLFVRTFGGTVTIQDPPSGQSAVEYTTAWPASVTDEYLTVGQVGDTRYGIQLKDIPPTAQLSATQAEIDAFTARYAASMNNVLAIAGIVPKADASRAGSDCWQPCDGGFEWRINGSEYLPACTNTPYHSVIKRNDPDGNEQIVSTQEFGFIIRCACPERLRVGDTITIQIDTDAGPAKTYAIGDTITIPIVAASALELAGGVDGDDTLVWTVRGSLGAVWPDYEAPLGAEPLYDEDGLQFRLTAGGVPFALGDAFTFSVCGGTWRWRRDGGAWSSSATITGSAVSLSDGLTLQFLPGPAPAFALADQWRWNVRQPHAPALALAPNRSAWRWASTGANWTAIFAADTPITAVALWHTCPVGAAFTVTGYSAVDVVLWAKVIPYRAGLAILILEGTDAVADCRKLRLTVASASGGSVRWLWAGVPWTPAHELATISLRESWTVQRGPNSARFVNRGAAGEIGWSLSGQSWIDSTDWTVLLAMIEALKTGGDLPFIFVPDSKIPAEARLVRIGDEIDLNDMDNFRYTPRRVMDVTLPLSAVALV